MQKVFCNYYHIGGTMGRSGKLTCTNDPYIYDLLKDPNYEVRADGTERMVQCGPELPKLEKYP